MKSRIDKMKIALVINNLERGGAQTLLLELMDRLDRSRFQPVLVYLSKPNDHEELLARNGHEAIYCRVRPQMRSDELKALGRLFDERAFDIVHAHTESAFFTTRVAALCSKPRHYIAHYHNSIEKRVNEHYIALEALLGAWTDQYVACSHSVEDFMRERVKLAKQPLKTIVNGIALNQIMHEAANREEARRDLNVSENCIHLVHVSRLKPVKCAHRIIEVLASVHDRIEGDWRLTFVGDGSEREKLEKIANANEAIARRIHFIGNSNNVPQWLAAADVFVLLSESEGLPIAAIEAMAAGVVPFVSNIPGMRGVIQDGKNGIIINTDDSHVAGEKLIELMKNSELRQRLASKAIQDAAQYDVSRFVSETEAMYERLLENPPKSIQNAGFLRRRLLFAKTRALAARAHEEYRKTKNTGEQA